MTNNEIYTDDAMNNLLRETVQCVQEYLSTQNDTIENIVKKSCDTINDCNINNFSSDEILNTQDNYSSRDDFDSNDISDSDSESDVEIVCNKSGSYKNSIIPMFTSSEIVITIILAGLAGYAVFRRR